MKANQLSLAQSQAVVLWLPVAALATVYGSITLSWVVYRVHLAELVTQLGFAPTFAPQLLLIETLLAIALEPLAGRLSDQTQQRQRNRFPLIWVGAALTAALFAIIPLLVTNIGATQPNGSIRWLVPVLLILWAIAIGILRSPALALLRHYAATVRLPQAASLLTLAAGLAGAVTPLGSAALRELGYGTTFIAVAILLLVTVACLRFFNPPSMAISGLRNTAAIRPSLLSLGLIFGIGATVTLVFRLAIEIFPKVLKAQLPDSDPPFFIGLVFLAIAAFAIPAGLIAARIGNSRAMLVGLGAIAALLVLLRLTVSSPMAIVLAIGLGIAYSLVSNGTFPLVLSVVSPRHAGLAIGLFFGGAAATASAFSIFFGKPEALSVTTGIWLGLISLLVAAICVTVLKPEHSAATG
ncbi:PucC family protein [Oculatella sp. FACHB-28]|uniref:PucC family protein n=1 Tax=Oculatella sp. FACHB-28 TaxID=2692845 RepID=UPI001689DAC6|nr:PucC family protein [Oculatella sp. FACHB-28]MBD2056184.1 PucC family protein [Oculatella sp. FACHB-28]